MNVQTEGDTPLLQPNFLVVGVGASAGGIEALQSFFANVSVRSNCAYVVILHLSPEHDSQLAQILQAVTSLPVVAIAVQTLVQPNHVYVISPKKHLSMADGHNHTELITIYVRPVLRHDDPRFGFLLVLFEPGSASVSDSEPVIHSEAPVAQQLEAEVLRLKQQLRSSSEELETSKEELQSINEELRTVNQELKVKIDDAIQTNANLQNLVNSTDIGTIFLDRALRLKLFTPAARALFNLIPADYGRILSDITNRLHNVDVLADAQTVLTELQMIEREVYTTDGRVYVLRVLPYRAPAYRIGGVVLTFFDITARKQTDAALYQSEERLKFALNASGMGTFVWHIQEDRGEPDGRMLALFGLPEDGTLNLAEALTTLIHPDDRAMYSKAVAQATDPAGNGRLYIELRVLHPDSSEHWLTINAQTYFAGEPRAAVQMYGMAIDITERKKAEIVLQRAHAELEQRVAERTAELLQLSNTRKELLQQLVTAQEAERQRIAHELHDGLGQYLSALIIDLGQAQALIDEPQALQAYLNRLQTIATQIDGELDLLIMELRPPALGDLGFDAALQRYSEEWEASNGIPVELVATGFGESRLPPAIEATAFRIVQEALTNIRKHAQANQVSIIMEQRTRELRVIVEDNGVGFNYETVARERRGGRQLGLLGMRERASLVGGTLTIESEAGQGTTIIPLKEEQYEHSNPL
jgi:signal transduction histidine kinase